MPARTAQAEEADQHERQALQEGGGQGLHACVCVHA
jgi:hypothetical protein